MSPQIISSLDDKCFSLTWRIVETDRKHGKRKGDDILHRALVPVTTSGTLQLYGMCLNHYSARVPLRLMITEALQWNIQ